MVQFQQWQANTSISRTPVPPNDTFRPFRWVGNHGGAKAEQQYAWPFADTDWKGARVIIYTQNGNNTSEFSRQLNGVDVGTKLVLGNGDPPAVPTVFLDLTIVAITTGDLIGIRMSTTVSAGAHSEINYTSYFEFADGLWGF